MRFEELNDDILSRLLRLVVFQSERDMELWKCNFPLIHVNRRWRALARPLVHRYAMIEAADGNKDDNRSIKTNINILDTGCAQRNLRVLNITLDSTMDFFKFYDSVDTLLAEYSDKLSTVSSIILSSFPWMNGGEELAQQNTARISRIANRFVQTMPNVTSVRFYSSYDCVLPYRLHGILASEYAPQLERLKISSSLTLPGPIQMNKLAHLSISLADHRHETNMLHVLSDSLVQMTLYAVPTNFFWDIFDHTDEQEAMSGGILFARLRTLTVLFVSEEGNDGWELSSKRTNSLHFPKLDNLSVYDIPMNTMFFSSCVFPDCIDDVFMAASTRRISSMLKHRVLLPRMNNMTLNVVTGNFNGPDDVAYQDNSSVIYDFLEKHHGCKATSLCLNAATGFNGACHIAKVANISSLSLYGYNNKSSVISVVESMPTLKSLTMDIYEVIEMFAIDTDRIRDKIEPWNTNINSLNIVGWLEGDTLPLTLHYIIMSIPTLTRVCVGRDILQGIDIFVQDYRELYPHLANIHFIPS